MHLESYELATYLLIVFEIIGYDDELMEKIRRDLMHELYLSGL